MPATSWEQLKHSSYCSDPFCSSSFLQRKKKKTNKRNTNKPTSITLFNLWVSVLSILSSFVNCLLLFHLAPSHPHLSHSWPLLYLRLRPHQLSEGDPKTLSGPHSLGIHIMHKLEVLSIVLEESPNRHKGLTKTSGLLTLCSTHWQLGIKFAWECLRSLPCSDPQGTMTHHVLPQGSQTFMHRSVLGKKSNGPNSSSWASFGWGRFSLYAAQTNKEFLQLVFDFLETQA